MTIIFFISLHFCLVSSSLTLIPWLHLLLSSYHCFPDPSAASRQMLQKSCSKSLCVQMGRRSTFIFCSSFRQKLLCEHRLTFQSRSTRKTSIMNIAMEALKIWARRRLRPWFRASMTTWLYGNAKSVSECTVQISWT